MELGKDITPNDIIDQLGFFDSWEDKYSYIIDLGKTLAPLPQAAYTEINTIKGCQSQVWITQHHHANRYIFQADSDAVIVKGLLAIILAAYNHKTADEIIAFDINDYFTQLDLLKHISNIRGNGVQAMIAHIRHNVTNSNA